MNLQLTKRRELAAHAWRGRWLLGAWIIGASACGAETTSSEEDADARPSEASFGAEPNHPDARGAPARDGGLLTDADLVPPAAPAVNLPCDANAALGELLGCSDAGVVSLCATDACKPSLAALPELGGLAETVRGATGSAVVALARDGGAAINECQSRYASCVGENLGPADIEDCNAAARDCGYDPREAVRPVCAAAFARCFLADLFDYDRCIAVFKECEASSP